MINVKAGFYGLSRDNYIYSLIRIESEKLEGKKHTLYDSLTDEEKKDIIEVEGKRYIRKMYDAKKGE